ncbi:MAG: hypothetical protein Q8873_06110 [Bacillota bacterium]|nr:hypothetical protein [Bacillota bacterium]
MKKLFPVIVIALILITLSSCKVIKGTDGAPTGLRDITWGMARTEVRKAETAKFMGYDDNYLFYHDTDKKQPIVEMGLNTNNNVDLWYYFNSEDKLFKIEYRLSTPKMTDDYYKLLKSLMSDMYGKPYKEDSPDKEDAHTKITSWKSGKSDIRLSYQANPSSISKIMYVTYLPNN